MAHFYLDLTGGNETIEDDDGVELMSLAEARAMAVVAARDIMAADIRAGILNLRLRISILDDERRLLSVVRFDQILLILIRRP